MSGILVHAITAATTATPNSIALLHRTLGGRPQGRVCISCTSPRTCEENEWAEGYLAQVVADAAARGPAS
ncbi:hypothetical protein GCM10010169_64070 [Micromonospora fulviviridis]|uniref:hypothetical protein n=1 Tax=Micromonospora fulviviridis TaxID=47860 RepID=UPI0019A7C4F4|nr:hypothetical protein [Micromonospora fulviviridis]GGS10614.1 hypothetical protein GCM10010169_64070 [Micromonospora fulviviridis]